MSRLTDFISGIFTTDAETPKTTVSQELSSSQLRVNNLTSDYENLFAQITPLADEMLKIQPYGVGRNGSKLPMTKTKELAVLDNPNSDMSREEFLKTCFTVWLSEKELNIRVHKDKTGEIIGYTILPVGCRTREAGGENRFYIYGLKENLVLTDAEVMTLRYSRRPRNLDEGVSPATASHYWAVIDDLIAQYQRAFFENGAVPATITFITASTKDRYDAKRLELERGLKGARNKNKTIYAWRQMLDDGSTGDEIEVKTIQGDNASLALSDIVGIVQDKLNMNFGVSNFILGDDSSAKYDNAELSDMQFTKRRVYPACIMFWGEFQHELDRITGGLGYAINFEIDIPELTERALTRANIKKAEEETLLTADNRRKTQTEETGLKIAQAQALINSGVSASTAIRAVGLYGDAWDAVAQEMSNLSSNTPEAQENALYGATEASFDRLTLDASSLPKPSFDADEVGAEAIYKILDEDGKLLISFATANPEEFLTFNLDGFNTSEEMQAKLGRIKIALNEAGITGIDGALERLKKELPEAISVQLAEAAEAGNFTLSEALTERISTRAEDFTLKYHEDVANALKGTIRRGFIYGTTKEELETELLGISGLSETRAETIARTESHSAINAGRLEADEKIANDYGVKIRLRWNAAAGACDICAAMNGTTVDLGEAFPDHAFTEDGTQVNFEHSLYNDEGHEPNAHPNCRCTFDEEVVLDD